MKFSEHRKNVNKKAPILSFGLFSVILVRAAPEIFLGVVTISFHTLSPSTYTASTPPQEALNEIGVIISIRDVPEVIIRGGRGHFIPQPLSHHITYTVSNLHYKYLYLHSLVYFFMFI